MSAGNAGDWGHGSGGWYIAASLGGYGPDEDVPIIQGILHSINSVILILFYYILRRGLWRMVKKIDKDNITPSDYTVWVKNLNRDFIDRELKIFLEEQSRYFGYPATIHNISVTYDINQYVRDTRDYAKLKGMLLFIEDYRKKHDGDYPKKTCSLFCCICCENSYPQEGILKVQMEEFERKIKRFEEHAEERYSQTTFAFVTFNKEEEAKTVVELWSISAFTKFFCCMCMPCFSGPLTFQGTRLKIEQAPEPSDVIWENLSATVCQKYLRRIITSLYTIVLLGGCFILVYLTKLTQKDYYETYENKPENERTYADLFQVRFFSVLLSLCIIIINRAIAIIVRLFSSNEKHLTWTSYHQAVTNKLVLALVLNSVAILVWVNSKSKDALFLPYGLVNDVLFLLLVDAIASPMTYIFSPLYLYKVHQRRKIKALARKGIIGITQIEANKLWENPEVDMAQRYANILKTLIVSFIFAPLFPIGLAIGFGSVTLQYWTDKILLLRRHSRPRNFGKGISSTMLTWIPLFILAYSGSNCAFLYIMNGTTEIYVPLGAFVLTAIYFIIPYKCFSKLRNHSHSELFEQINLDEKNEYEEKAIYFNEDYMRLNPLTAKEGWKDWLNLVEKKRGKEEKKKMQQRFSTALQAANNPRNYAYQQPDIEGGGRRTIALNPLASVLGLINQHAAAYAYLNLSLGPGINNQASSPSQAQPGRPGAQNEQLYEHYYH